MYTEEEWKEARAIANKRIWTAVLPAALMIGMGIAVFVIGRIHRSSSAWVITALLTMLGAGFLVFWNGVYAKPMKVYARHIDYMLHGKQAVTEGVVKSFSEETYDRDGLLFYAMMVNVGKMESEEDDRLFYFDSMKAVPEGLLGKRVRVTSNDKKVSTLSIL